LLYAVVQGFVMQDAAEALAETQALVQGEDTGRLAQLLGGALAIKAAQSDKALALLDAFNPRDSSYLHFVSYLKGEVYLHEGAYRDAMQEYRWFVNNYRGQHYIKDAWYKTGLCAYLEGKVNDAREYFRRARAVGREDTEADKYAARALNESRLPHKGLLRVRYFTDGGYYEKAAKELAMINNDALTDKRDRAEYYYRHARLSHKTGRIDDARRYYEQTIRACGNEPWYFAPNACLQMGYISLDAGDTTRARDYFIKARKYPKHEYKNSIDSKAKSALATIN
jgi:tetratricopeptide (TPR) repeat protein